MPVTAARRRPVPADLFREIAIVAVAAAVYYLIEGLAADRADVAVRHAADIASVERALGFYWEPGLQEAVLPYGWLVTLFNWVYLWAHWPLIAPVATWLFFTRLDVYRLYRTAFLVAALLAFTVFFLYPVAPPRLADQGFVDTVVEYSSASRILQPPALMNQYAAFPSLHFCWNVLTATALFREARRPAIRAFACVVPVAMLLAIVVTANHYILDALAGVALAAAALAFAAWVRGREPAPQRGTKGRPRDA